MNSSASGNGGDGRLIAYYRPFPWDRINSERSGRTSVERTIRAFCRQESMRVAGFVMETDERLNRSFEDRVAGAQAMAQLRTGEADGIIVQRSEHIFSSAADAIASIERWLDERISFYCIDFLDGMPLHLGPERLDIRARMLIRGLSALQRRADYERTRRRMASRKTRGSWTGRVPFGFQLVHGLLVEDDDRIERIQRIKKEHRRGLSYREIARRHGISVGTTHRLVKTDLRKLRRIVESTAQELPNAGSTRDIGIAED